MLNFSQITDKLPYPRKFKAILTRYHSNIIDYVMHNPVEGASDKRYVLHCMNSLSYIVINEDFLPDSYPVSDPLDEVPKLDSYEIKDALVAHKIYLDYSDIEWDLPDSTGHKAMYLNLKDNQTKPENILSLNSEISSDNKNVIEKADEDELLGVNVVSENYVTSKEDLYIQGPLVPRFDYNKPFLVQHSGQDLLAIYYTLPMVPEKQCEISVTTDVSLMRSSDLLKLFPTTIIHTRSAEMYDKSISDKYSLNYDDKLGIIFPVCNFKLNDIKDNIIKYPHIYQLKRYVDDKYMNFYSRIEVDGELHKIADIWDTLSDTSKLPKTKEFMKEYVVRRYLLERDILGVEHSYPIWGGLEPFLTLFMTPDDYKQFGHLDPVELARNCVQSRVNYKRARNPIFRRLGYV